MNAPRNQIRVGCRIRWPSMRLEGYVLQLSRQIATVILDNNDQHQVNIASGAIEAAPYTVGDRVTNQDGMVGTIREAGLSTNFPDWRIDWADGSSTTQVEMTLRPAQMLDPVERIGAGRLSSAAEFNLRSTAADMWARNRGEELVSLAHARVDLKPHQVSVAHRVVSEFPHRFLLCDEVGLGKTIEAAMVLKELRARGGARRVLILVPAGIQRQWQFELKGKFGETFSIFNRHTIDSLQQENVHNAWAERHSVITSHTFAAHTDERIAEIAVVPWDLVIVDEAHHARRQRRGASLHLTRLYRLVNELAARPEFSQRSVLFLTATPMQLQRHELFSLVEMLNHTLFASEEDFERHLNARSGVNRLAEQLDRLLPVEANELARALPTDWFDLAGRLLRCGMDDLYDRLADPSALLDEIRAKHRLSEVVLRNRRAVVVGFMPRRAFRWELKLSPQEVEIQEAMEEVIREGFDVAAEQRRNAVGFLMVTWQKLLASSSRALRCSLERRCARLEAGDTVEQLSEQLLEDFVDEELSQHEEVESYVREAISGEIERLGRIIAMLRDIAIDTKAQVLLEQLRELFVVHPQGKVLLFTQFRDTQEMLQELLSRQDWGAHVFHCGLNVAQKDAAIEAFRSGRGPQLLISTEAGGEGRNLQFAHLLVNYDLPWNPMRVEQRIGRVDRVGQEHEVLVYNFHVVDSIESRILDVLEKRINLFESSIGGLEPILGDVEDSIRRALRLTAEARDRALVKIGERTESAVEKGRLAEAQLEDFVLDNRRSYPGGIIELINERKVSTVAQQDFERMLTKLLSSVNTYIGPEKERGERTIHFHPPFTEEERALIDGAERRRVCFDPRVSVDSAQVEYFGFGHPIVDALVKRATETGVDGAAAIRAVSTAVLPDLRPGWQFNWVLKVSGAQPKELVLPVFVDDQGNSDLRLGRDLLHSSRAFDGAEERESRMGPIRLDTLSMAHSMAETIVAGERDSMIAELSSEALERHNTDTDRINNLYQSRLSAAERRHANDVRNLERLRASNAENDRRVVPIWEENVRRSKAAAELIKQDRSRELQQLSRALQPEVSYHLLCVARIEPR